MSRKNEVTESQRLYIARLKAGLPVTKAETEVLEWRERHLRAMINTYHLQKEWEVLEEKLEEEFKLQQELETRSGYVETKEEDETTDSD